MGFQDVWPKMGVLWGKIGEVVVRTRSSFWGFYVCANFGENRTRSATVRVLADGQIHRLTDANRFYNLSHAICYSYGTDKDGITLQHIAKMSLCCEVISSYVLF